MKRALFAILLIAAPLTTLAADLVNGERINRNCALCHGIYGQGTPGRLSPRLAGMPKEYLFKATKEYKEGKRINPLMVEISGLYQMSDRDIEDVSAYLESLDLSPFQRFNVRHHLAADLEKGDELYNEECRLCHARDGYGNPKKDAPPLAGQHGEYLFQSMKMFQAKVRVHDNDPADDSFDTYTDKELYDMVAFITTLDDPRIDDTVRFSPASFRPLHPAAPIPMAATAPPKRAVPGLRITDITQTVAQMELKSGVSVDDAIQAMRSKAIDLNLKLVGEQHVSRELKNRGVDSPYLSIFQFCNPMDAKVMVVNNPIFSSYMPCRISMVEDQQGKMWLMMLNLDMLINSQLLAPEVVDTAIRVNQQMLEIMVAGATGEF